MTSPAAAAAPRRIIHVDMDAFFVACEVLRRPELAGKAVIVGGDSRRGVVAAASYEARQFGVHSAMSAAQATRLCPHAITIAGDHAYYGEISRAVFAIFETFTPIVEPIAFDEAFLDVTGSQRLFGPAEVIGRAIRQKVRDELNLAASVGIAPIKMVAKLASEAAKPTARPGGITPGAGVVSIEPDELLPFLHAHPVRALWGVGPKTFEKLQRLGISTVGELAAIDRGVLVHALGRANGLHLHLLANGIDDREVVASREAKSIGNEETFAHDRHSLEELHRDLVRLADMVCARLREAHVAARTVSIKVRFGDFETISRALTVPEPIDDLPSVLRVTETLLEDIPVGRGVRLFGISCSHLTEHSRQLSLDEVDTGWGQATDAVEEIRRRFGAGAIGPAVLTIDGKLRLARRGEQAWGPNRLAPDERPSPHETSSPHENKPPDR